MEIDKLVEDHMFLNQQLNDLLEIRRERGWCKSDGDNLLMLTIKLWNNMLLLGVFQ
jgi:hypothetical protein